MRLSFNKLVLLLCLGGGITFGGPQDHEIKGPPGGQGGSRPLKNGNGPGPTQSSGEGCSVDPAELAMVANGERSSIAPVVTYLTAPPCIVNHLSIARAAIAKGIEFNQAPFQLDSLVKMYPLNSLQSEKKLEELLRKRVPQQMEDHAFSVQEQIPLVAQLAVLSRSTGTWALGNLIKDELMASTALLLGKERKEGQGEELAKNLIEMGATENAVMNEFANIVEEMALLSQADALGRILKGLAGAAGVEGAMVPVFNSTAGAFLRGVEKGKKGFTPDQARNLTSAGLEGAKEAIQGNSLLNPGISDLNEAFRALLSGKAVQSLSLKSLWKEIVRALAVTPLLPNLAEMMAGSVTPQLAFLQERDRKNLLAASKNYPILSIAIQKNILLAWDEAWDALHRGEMTVEDFNERREKLFKPIVGELLDNEFVAFDDTWLHAALRRSLVKDETIEKKFPGFVLNLLERREKTLSRLSEEPAFEPAVQVLAQNFALLWSLSHVYIPALKKWVDKYE